jgi:hypothetical protein
MKSGEIILCNGIKMDKEYENVLSYDTESLVSLCRSKAVAISNSYSILDPSKNSIDVALPYASCIYANYIAFRNPHYGNKWYFAFVNNVKYVNNKVTTIEYKVDVFSTWYDRFNIGKAFIEREHVSDDTIGKHTVPERLDTGDFIINDSGVLDEFGSDAHVVIGVTKVPDELANMQSVVSGSVYNAPNTVYNGIFNGLTYFVFQTTYDASQFLAIMDLMGNADNVINVFLCPLSIYEVPIGSWNNQAFTYTWGSINMDLSFRYNRFPTGLEEVVMADNKTVTINNTLDGYTPKNNKMFTKEFNYLYLTNYNGGNVTYAYEDFKNNTPKFRIIGAVCPGCSIRLTPLDYKKWDTTNASYKNDLLPYGLVGGKYPTCSWRSDTYTNWLTQNSVNYTMDTISTVGSLAIAGSINPAIALMGGVGLITDSLLEKEKRETSPVQAKGNVNVGDVTYSASKTNFGYFQMSCRYEFAKICDDYLSRFGYKINEVKTPNILSRKEFNFIKVGGRDELVSGNIPATDLEEINNIFRKGVTIFHDYDTFGNYTINNPIV